MIRGAGRITMLFGVMMWLAWSVFSFEGEPTVWEQLTRFDIVLGVLCLAGAVAVVVAFAVRWCAALDRIASSIAVALAGFALLWGLDVQWQESGAVVWALMTTTLLVTSTVLLSLSPEAEVRITSTMRGAAASARAPEQPVARQAPASRAPAAVAAGWYPDPSGHHASRYWDGTGWTERVS